MCVQELKSLATGNRKKSFCVTSGGYGIFLGRRQLSKWVYYFAIIFAENCMKMKEFGPKWCRIVELLNSPLVIYHLITSHFMHILDLSMTGNYRPPMKLQEGNVFSHVRLSVILFTGDPYTGPWLWSPHLIGTPGSIQTCLL